MAHPGSTVVVLTQVYPPDPAAVGQYLAEACEALAARGNRVVVITARRGYDDPSVRYRRREELGGVEVRRVPGGSLGKGSIMARLVGGLLFSIQAGVRAMTMRGVKGVLVSTAPQVGPMTALAVSRLRRIPFAYWLMDLNPDQMIHLGKLKPTSVATRAFEAMNRAVFRRAGAVIVLDRFMAERVERKQPLGDRLHVVPLWPLGPQMAVTAGSGESFRSVNGWGSDLVIMYSGNHGLTSPIDDLLAAALRSERPRVRFAFIGGGAGKADVDRAIAERRPTHISSLPYQPLSATGESLSAADVHVVTLGRDAVGIVHPSKVYGAIAVGRPVLYIGPEPSHISELISAAPQGWSVRPGDVDALEAALDDIARLGRRGLGGDGGDLRREREQRIGALCAIVERVVRPTPGSAPLP